MSIQIIMAGTKRGYYRSLKYYTIVFHFWWSHYVVLSYYSNLTWMIYSMLKNLNCDRTLCFFCSTTTSSLISQMIWLGCTWTLQKLFHLVWNSLCILTLLNVFLLCVVPIIWFQLFIQETNQRKQFKWDK